MNPLSTWQLKIQTAITTILDQAAQQFSQYPLDQVQIEYLSKLAIQGKQFRGSLLVGFYQSLLGVGKNEESLYQLAAAIELYGTGILIHDDVIDRSDQRRGLSSIHRYMEEVAGTGRLIAPAHFGVSAAICLADFLFFIADKTVAELAFASQLKLNLAITNHTELAGLGLAEIEDVRLSFSNQQVSKEEILEMYLGKTGRYTGRWPLLLAAQLAELSPELIGKLAKIGEKIGLLYQLKDDELGIFGDQEKIGKSTTSDLLEGKKTLYYFYLQQELSPKERATVFSIIGNQAATVQQLTEVKAIITTTGIQEKVAAEITQLQQELLEEIDRLTSDISVEAITFLHQIVLFVVDRKK